MNKLSERGMPANSSNTSALSGMSSKAFRYDVNVAAQGQVEVYVPLRPGSHVTVFVIETPGDPFGDLVQAAHSSLEFWDNPFDDEDWNDD